MAEISPKQRAGQIIYSFVDDFVKNRLPHSPSKIRAVNQCMLGLYAKLKEEGLGKDFYPLQATIGDIDPWAIGLNSRGEQDPFEQGRFTDLSERLGLDPEKEGGIYDQIREKQKEVDVRYKKTRVESQEPTWVPSRYYPEGGRGSTEARAFMTEEVGQLGLVVEAKDVWMGYGGMDIIQRTARAVTTHLENKTNGNERKTPLLLSASVGFTMAMNSAHQHGPHIDFVPTSDLPGDELTAERLQTHFDQGASVPDMMLLTPANNPTAQSNNPEMLRGVIETMLEKNKGVVFLFDMAYMWTIPREKALRIMDVIKETGADKQAVFVVSESKKMGRPGTRIAAAIVSDGAIRDRMDLHAIMHADTMTHEPSWSGDLDTLYQALSDKSIIPDSTYNDLSALLRQRQRAFLDVIREIDPDHIYFDEETERIVIPGDEKERNADSLEQDVPLYLWLRLKEGVSAFDVLKKLGIGGAPSEVFGPEGGDCDRAHLRLSMGFVSTADILSKSKKIEEQWRNKLD